MKKTGSQFTKPFFKEIFGSERTVYYAYPREELLSEPIFPYFVFDGGAFNFANDRFGTADGDRIRDLTVSGKLFDVFSLDGQFNWKRSFAFTEGFPEFTPKYEWQIWPARLYMTIPLAQEFLRTGDWKWADEWLKIVRQWDRANPYQPFDGDVPYLKTDMVWRDMQVAWRSLSLMHGMFMLQDAPFDRETWEYLYRFLELHIRHLCEEGEDRLKRGLMQNHVLQIGVALIMAACLFPEFDNSAALLKTGADTVKMNMGAIFPDGGSDEDSPSYSHFVVRLYLEAYLLMKNNGYAPIDGIEESIKRQYEWLYQCSAPSGRVMRISDSYGMSTYDDIKRAEKLIPLTFPREKRSVLFPGSGVGVIRKNGFTLLTDAMARTNGHRHWGRPQTLLYRGETPVLVDSGCSNYDLWDFYLYLRGSGAHNVVFSPDFDDDACTVAPEITRFDADNGVISTFSRVSCGGKSYTWERTVKTDGNAVIFTDRAVSEHSLKWQAAFHLYPHHIKQTAADTVKQLADGFLLTVKTSLPCEVTLTPVMNDENRRDYCDCVVCRGEGKEFGLVTIFEFADRQK